VKHLLDNIFWHALTGPHARFATGVQDARRYARGFSPIVAFANPGHPDFAALERLCERGEHFYCDGWSGSAPAGWRIDVESTMFKMAWEGAMPPVDEAPEAVPLGREHAAQAFEPASPAPARSARERSSSVTISAVSTASDWWRWLANARGRGRSARSAESARTRTFAAGGLRVD
jgi:hypothetical protein